VYPDRFHAKQVNRNILLIRTRAVPTISSVSSLVLVFMNIATDIEIPLPDAPPTRVTPLVSVKIGFQEWSKPTTSQITQYITNGSMARSTANACTDTRVSSVEILNLI
jgi:hypothetical protein